MAGVRITQLAPTAQAGRRYGSFAGKAAAGGMLPYTPLRRRRRRRLLT